MNVRHETPRALIPPDTIAREISPDKINISCNIEIRLDDTRRKSTKFKTTRMNFVPENFPTPFAAYRCVSPLQRIKRFQLFLSLPPLFLYFHSESKGWSGTVYRIRGKIEIEILPRLTKRTTFSGRTTREATLIHRPIWSTGVQIPRWRRSIFINGSALTSPGTCVTVNAHSTERCGTLSLSMTDITHSRTSRRLLWIPYGNAARPISRTVHLWNWHRAKHSCFTVPRARHCLKMTPQIAGNNRLTLMKLYLRAPDWDMW